MGKSSQAKSAAPNAATGPGEAPETPHFSGKRASERIAADLSVELRGGGVVLHGRAVDLSPEGLRVRMPESVLRSFSDAVDPVAFFAAVERHFAQGFEVWFPGHGLRQQAEVIRLVTRPRGGGDVFLGCRFSRPLCASDWARLKK